MIRESSLELAIAHALHALIVAVSYAAPPPALVQPQVVAGRWSCREEESNWDVHDQWGAMLRTPRLLLKFYSDPEINSSCKEANYVGIYHLSSKSAELSRTFQGNNSWHVLLSKSNPDVQSVFELGPKWTVSHKMQLSDPTG